MRKVRRLLLASLHRNKIALGERLAIPLPDTRALV